MRVRTLNQSFGFGNVVQTDMADGVLKDFLEDGWWPLDSLSHQSIQQDNRGVLTVYRTIVLTNNDYGQTNPLLAGEELHDNFLGGLTVLEEGQVKRS